MTPAERKAARLVISRSRQVLEARRRLELAERLHREAIAQLERVAALPEVDQAMAETAGARS